MAFHYKDLPKVLAIGIVAFGCALPLSSGTAAASGHGQGPATLAQSSNAAIAQLLSTNQHASQALADTEEVRRFYAARSFAPAWTGPSAGQNIAIAMGVLENADEEGLSAADYHVAAIRVRQKAASESVGAELDVLITDSMLTYARDMREGRARRGQVRFPIGVQSIKFDPAGELSRAIAAHRLPQFLLGLEPGHREYARLKAALARYRAIAATDGWPAIRGAEHLDLASSDSRVAQLRKRLAMEDPTFSPEGAYEKDLVYALARYQQRNRLAPGPLSKQTLEALNVAAGVRANQIAANMERWRWFWQPFKSTRIEVNSADATLTAYQNSVSVVKSNIIAGRPASPTPLFTANAAAIVLNPSWNIPAGIANREILPKAARNPHYLTRQHIIADKPGGGLRQLPGSWNALGRIKVDMPNRFHSYLHDTNTPALFARQDRHLSHGCMRVEQIRQLASFVLTGSATAAKEKIEAAIGTGKRQRLPVNKPVPVYVGYWTALLDDSGAVGFAPDVYGLDRKVLLAMRGPGGMGQRVSTMTDCSRERRAQRQKSRL